MYLVLVYEYGPDMIERRKPHREAHLALIRKLHAEGRIVLAGAFQPLDGGLLVFKVDAASEVEAFMKDDPYVQHGLVKSSRLREWNLVVGGA